MAADPMYKYPSSSANVASIASGESLGMGWLKDRIATLREAVGVRRFAIDGAVAVVLALLNWLATEWEQYPLKDTPNWFVWLFIATCLVAWWLLNYATELRGRLAPKVELSYEPKEPWERYLSYSSIPLPNNPQNQAPSRWFRVRVHNPERAVRVMGCSVALVRVEYWVNFCYVDTGFAVPQKLRWSETHDAPYGPRDIAHAESAYVDLISLDPVHNKVLVKWPENWIANERLFENVGDYRLTVAATPAVGEATVLTLVLKWTGDWATAQLRSVSA
jgi:hypothetical protein